jgi:glycosyltransferase involved in cell wall biosynthesis
VRVVVAHSRLNSFGGGERVTLELLRGLSTRHDVLLWAGDYQPNHTFAELANFPRREVPPPAWLYETPAADVVITQSFGSNLLALRHPTTVCYLHTMRSAYLRSGSRPDLIARRLLDQAAVRRATAVLTNSEFTATAARLAYQRRPEVVPPGVDAAFFDAPLCAGDYGLYVGRLAPEKGVERLLEWWSDVPLDLVVVGDGEAKYVDYLRALAGPRVDFRGPLTGTALTDAYASCRFLAFLPFAEEFGIVALEAMAVGKPVIASYDGGLTSLVRNGHTGYLVRDAGEFSVAAHRLTADDAACLRLGARGREEACRYSWARFVTRIEAVCQERVAAHIRPT